LIRSIARLFIAGSVFVFCLCAAVDGVIFDT
jgi:hypothetical protein